MKKMINLIKKIFPGLFPSIHIVWGFSYDIYKFLRTATDFSPENNKQKLVALLTRQYHGVEKALTLPNPRLGFGKTLIPALVQNTSTYYSKFGYDALVQTVLDNLNEYLFYNSNYNDASFQQIKNSIENLLDEVEEYKSANNQKVGGRILISKTDWLKKTAFDFKSFSASRMSTRDFSKEKVNKKLLKEAILIAMKSPSACNRQPWRVRIFKEEKKEHILKFQNGNRGFAETIDTILLITGLTSSFSYSERHEAWIDGGLFSMSLIYALHSLGLGVCALNTSYTVKGEKALRNAISLPLDEEPIMMLAVGHLKEKFWVTKSNRKALKEVLIDDSHLLRPY